MLAVPFIYNWFEFLVGGQQGYSTFVSQYLCPQPGVRILDIGCGTGNLRPHFKNQVNYVGYDVDRNYVEFAKQNYSGNFFCCDTDEFKSLWGNQEQFDIIFAYGVLHHIDDLEVEKICELAQSLLVPNGKFVTCDPCVTESQTKIARWVVENDRGKYVRNERGYLELIRPFFNITSEIRENMIRIPTSLLIVEGTLQREMP